MTSTVTGLWVVRPFEAAVARGHSGNSAMIFQSRRRAVARAIADERLGPAEPAPEGQRAPPFALAVTG